MNARIRLLFVPSGVLALGLACTAAMTLGLSRLAAGTDVARFDYEVAQTHDLIAGRIDTYVAMLEAGAAMLEAVDLDLSAAEFRAFAARLNLAQRYPGVQGVGYSVRVRRGAAPLLRESMRVQGVQGFRMWPDGTEIDGERHAIIYLEPQDDRNRAAVGYDMFSEPERRAAMERARDTGRPAASGALALVQEITDDDRQPGFLIYVPVYEAGDPGEVETRRRALAGFVYSPFRVNDMMRGVFARAPAPQLSVALYDGRPNVGVLMHTSNPGKLSDRADLRTALPLTVAGRDWTVIYSPGPDFLPSPTHGLAKLALIAGTIISLLLAAGAWWQGRTSQKARGRARELAVFNALGARLATEPEPQPMLQAVVEAGVALTGAQAGAFLYEAEEVGGRTERRRALAGAPDLLHLPERGGALARPVRIHDVTHGVSGAGALLATPPAGSRLRSWLAAPVMGRSGDVLGVLVFGHERAGRFDARAERLAVSLATQAAIAAENARLWRNTQAEMDHRKLLLDELNHRVKNTLAIVQSMAAQTLRGADSLSGFGQSFESRLIAMSSTHNLLTRGAWRGAQLRALLEAELAPFERHGAARVDAQGPDVHLTTAEATSLGMAFHELTANAVKYGALSTPEGRVIVRWTVAPEDARRRLRIEWRERGGPPVSAPKRRGFGSRLIERGLPGQHQGAATLRFEAAGLVCLIDVLLAAPPQEET